MVEDLEEKAETLETSENLDVFIELRPEDIEKFFIIQIGKAGLLEPRQFQMSVNALEGILKKDWVAWKEKDKDGKETGKGYLELVTAKRDEVMKNIPDSGWQLIELTSFKFQLLYTIWRDKRPQLLRSRVK